jgi:transcriptional regulator with XRE-family HTH domain
MGPKKTFIREWRTAKALTQERLAEHVGMTHGNLSKIERGLQPYDQPTLEALAVVLETDTASLLMRNPTDPDGIWTVWDKVPPEQRARVIEVIKAMIAS